MRLRKVLLVPLLQCFWPLMSPESPKLHAAALYQWQKALLRTGTRRLSRCAGTGLLIATYGSWGHGAYPSVTTLAAASGESESTIGRHLGVLRQARWLLASSRPGRTTVYCISAVEGGQPLGPSPAQNPCQHCRGLSVTTVKDDGALPAAVTDDQEFLPRNSAAAGSPEESRSHAALALAHEVHTLRPDATDADLLLFSKVADEFIGVMPDDVLLAATEAFARRGHYFTAAAIRSFFEKQRTFRRTSSPRSAAAAASAANKQQADLDMIHKKRQMIIAWEREHGDDHSDKWISEVNRCHDFYLDEVIADWRAAGRGYE